MDAPDPVNAQLRQLPGVDALADLASKDGDLPHWSLIAGARRTLAEVRAALLGAELREAPKRDELIGQTRARARDLAQGAPQRVLNATGVVLHTNLGRAPLSNAAADAVAAVARGYSDLELDLETGQRGSRLGRVTRLLEHVSGAEAAHVVNNNAAAVFLALDALAADREVVLSRGELVEIGGSFRVPDILAASRARLVEVGTTNRTHLRDYANAIGPDTGALLKVHRSNFDIRGFTKEVRLSELAPLARERGLPLIEDRGSGTFVDLTPHGVPEPEAQRGLTDGADLVLFSGDKLLGGPQAGIVLGRRELVERMRTSPLARAVRVDKLVLAALHATVVAILDGDARADVPVLSMLTASPDELRARAERLSDGLAALGYEVGVHAQGSLVGGGALPDLELDGFAVRVEARSGADTLARALRTGSCPVLTRVQQGAVWLDPRTLTDEESERVVDAFRGLLV